MVIYSSSWEKVLCAEELSLKCSSCRWTLFSSIKLFQW